MSMQTLSAHCIYGTENFIHHHLSALCMVPTQDSRRRRNRPKSTYLSIHQYLPRLRGRRAHAQYMHRAAWPTRLHLHTLSSPNHMHAKTRISVAPKHHVLPTGDPKYRTRIYRPNLADKMTVHFPLRSTCKYIPLPSTYMYSRRS